MKDSVWLEVPGFEGLYEVSDDGQVRSVTHCDRLGRKHLSTVLHQVCNKQGYMKVILTANGTHHTKLVHRLVASAFVKNQFNLPMINHKDEDKTNNCANNLEWCDATYNNNYGTANYRQARAKGTKVAQYTCDNKFVADYYSISEACRRTGFSVGAIWNGIKHGRPTNGYYWRQTDEVKIYA